MTVPYYNANEIAQHHEQIEGALKHPNWFSRAGLVRTTMDGIPTTSVIADIGSGTGGMVRQIFALGYTNVRCVDIDDYLDRSQLGGSPAFFRADVSKEAIPIPDASCDCVFAVQILEHLENPWHCAREILRITKPGGRIIVSIPFATSFINRLNFLWRGDIDSYRTNNNHIAVFTNQLFQLLWRGHARVIRTETAEGYLKIGSRKIRFRAGTFLGKCFSRKIVYILERT